MKAVSYLDVYSRGVFLESTEKFWCYCYLNVLVVISYIPTAGEESMLNSPLKFLIFTNMVKCVVDFLRIK